MTPNMLKRLWAGVKRAFGDESFEPYKIDAFSDHTVNTAYETVKSDFSKTETDSSKPSKPVQLIEEAKGARGTSDRNKQIRAACIYLRHAQLLTSTQDSSYPQEPTAAEAYHYAANEFRQLDLLDRAAQCYFNSAVSALLASRAAATSDRTQALPLPLALRSAGRAKALYASLGDDERSDRAHQLRQEVSRRGLALERKYEWILLYVWKVVTGYGASINRWFTALLFSLIAFALLYSAGLTFCYIKLANDAPSFPAITPVYLSVLNLLQFGSYTQIVPLHWSAQVILMLHGAVAFVLVGTGVTFLTKK